MNVFKVLKNACELEKHWNQFPDWYWKHGLHDAELLSVSKLEFEPDYRMKPCKRNCFEMDLDSKGAIYEQDIQKIALYNYKIKTLELDLNSYKKLWWMGDDIKELDNKKYLSEIEFESDNRERITFIIEFEFAEITRK